MKLHQLNLLCALEQYHSFSKTAEHLFLSQPALSASLRALEKELHCTLLTRSNKGVQFTPTGKHALNLAHEILNEITLIRAIAANAQKTPEELTIASNTFTCIDLLLSLFRQIKLGEAEPSVNLQEIDEHTLIHELLYGTLDFAILQINATQLDEEHNALTQKYPFTFIELAREPIVVLLSQTHPLAKESALSISDLLTYPFVTAHADTDHRLINAMELLGVKKPLLEIRDTFSLNHLIAEGRHWAFIPQSEGYRYIDNPHQSLITLPLTDLSCACSYLWLHSSDNYPEEEALLLQSSRTLLHEKLINKEASL